MSELPTTAAASPSASAIRRVEEVCDDFETALKAGSSPKPEDYLGRVAVQDRPRLKEELEALVADYRPPRDDASTPLAPVPAMTTPFIQTENSGENRLPDLIGRYQILGWLGEGGMGIVYRAHHPVLNQDVALKTIRPRSLLSSGEAERILGEARNVAKLKHPHVVTIHDADEENGRPYFTMALVESGTLADRIAEFQLGTPTRNGKGKPDGLTTLGWSRKQLKARKEKMLTLVEKVCRAVHAAHTNVPTIIHRDLKPSNILMDGDEPKVSDFGLAKMVLSDDDETQPGDGYSGTPPYMSPEQHRGETKNILAPSDVWAIGVILYELFTGRRPFPGKTRRDFRLAVRNTEPPRPRELNKCIDRDLEAIILKCLEKDAAERYKSAAELSDELMKCRDEEFTQTRPPTRLRRLIRVLRRSSYVPAVASLALLMVATIIILAFRPDPPPDPPPFDPPERLIAKYTEQEEIRLKAMQKELYANKPVQLLTEGGLPLVCQTKDFGGESKMSESAGDWMVEQLKGSTIVYLLPDPACLAYEFTGQVRHDSAAKGGYVGLCALASERLTPRGMEHSFFGLAFADRGGMVVDNATAGRKHPYVDAFLHRQIGTVAFHAMLLGAKPASLSLAPNAFRRFRIVVQEASLAFYLDDSLIETFNRAEVLSIALHKLGYQLDPDNPPEGEIVPRVYAEFNRGFRDVRLRDVPAIFVIDGAATFRDLRLTPISR